MQSLTFLIELLSLLRQLRCWERWKKWVFLKDAGEAETPGCGLYYLLLRSKWDVEFT